MNAKSRLRLCKSCPLSRKSKMAGVEVVTCGELNLLAVPPVIGSVVEYMGQKVNLCGCVMQVKTMLSSATCPIERWK